MDLIRSAWSSEAGIAGYRAGVNCRGMASMMRKVQGALPVIGLISRLTTPEGGVGSDELAYPEYCRKVFEASPEGFQIAVPELQNRYGKSAQRRFVLLCLWMVKEGCVSVPKS